MLTGLYPCYSEYAPEFVQILLAGLPKRSKALTKPYSEYIRMWAVRHTRQHLTCAESLACLCAVVTAFLSLNPLTRRQMGQNRETNGQMNAFIFILARLTRDTRLKWLKIKWFDLANIPSATTRWNMFQVFSHLASATFLWTSNMEIVFPD